MSKIQEMETGADACVLCVHEGDMTHSYQRRGIFMCVT